METRKNGILLGVILALCGIYFIGTQKEWIVVGNIPLLILGGAFFLLYYTKQKAWALWSGILFLCMWAIKFSSPVIHMSGVFGYIVILLISGSILLFQYQKTGWESYVTPGCFLIWIGFFRFLVEITGYFSKFCPLLIISLLMVVYTSHIIKRKKVSAIKIMLQGMSFYFIVSLCLGQIG